LATPATLWHIVISREHEKRATVPPKFNGVQFGFKLKPAN